MARVLVGLSASDTWYGKAIRKLTDSEYNHAFLLYESQLWGGWWIVEVDNKGVRKVPAEKIVKKMSTIKLFECDIDWSEGLRDARSYIGAKYDWVGIFGFLLKALVWNLLGRKIMNPVHKKAKMFCSELIMFMLRASEAPGSEFFDPASASPEVLDEFLSKSGWCREVPRPI